MKAISHDLAIVVGIASAVCFLNLGGPCLWDRDEPRNAGCAYEMLERNDWVVPVFNDQLRTHKPVLLYWCIMSAYETFGVNEFAARFWSALLAVATVTCTYFIALRLRGRRIAFWSACALATMLMFDVAARAATPDAVLIFPSTFALLIYVWATFAPHDSQRGTRLRTEGVYFPTHFPTVIAIYGVMGVAVLAKGPVGLVMPTAVIGMFLLIKRLKSAENGRASVVRLSTSRWQRWSQVAVTLVRPFAPIHFLKTCIAMRPITAITTVSLIAMPWYLWVHLRTDGEWTHGFFLVHNLARATSAMENHRGSILFYPVAMLVGTFPWSVFTLPTLIDTCRNMRKRDRDALIFASCWVGVYLGIFSIAQTKLPSYITPAYPGFAILAGGFVSRWLDGRDNVARFWPYVSFGVFAIVGSLLAVGLPVAASSVLANEAWLGVIVGLVPLVGGAAAIQFAKRAQRQLAGASFLSAAVVFSIVLLGVCAARVGRYQPSQELVDVSGRWRNPIFASVGQLEPSWVFYAKRPVAELSEADVSNFLSEGPGRYLITNDRTFARLGNSWPTSATVIRRTPQFLKPGELLLIESASPLADRGRPSNR